MFASLTFINWHFIRNDSNAVASSGGPLKSVRNVSALQMKLNTVGSLCTFTQFLSVSVRQHWPASLTYNRRLNGTSQVMWELRVGLLCSNCSFTQASFTMHNLSLASTHPPFVPSLGPSLLCWPTFLLTCLSRLLSTLIKSDWDKDVLLLLSSSLGKITLLVLHGYCCMAKTHNTLATV